MRDELQNYVSKIKSSITAWDLLEMNAVEKLKVAEAIQAEVDWIRFRAGMDKECFECRAKNSPEALTCVECKVTIICEPCSKINAGGMYPWRCQHGGGVRMEEALKMARRSREDRTPVADKVKREREPAVPEKKFDKFSFGEDE